MVSVQSCLQCGIEKVKSTAILLFLTTVILFCMMIKQNQGVKKTIHSIVKRANNFQIEMAKDYKSQEALKKQLETYILLLRMRQFEKVIFSQNGEDGIIDTIFNHIGTKTKYFVEFGTESGVQCNTRYLREMKNWTGLLMDGGFEDEEINLHKEMIYPSNIVKLFTKYKVPKKFDLLSVDTDFKDWFILRNILKAGYRPRVIITEVNTFIPDNEAKTVPLELKQSRWDGSSFFGFSVTAGWMLARHFGYSMIYCDVEGVNCFYVIDGEEGFGAGFRISDYYPAIALWRRNRLGHPRHKQDLQYTTITSKIITE